VIWIQGVLYLYYLQTTKVHEGAARRLLKIFSGNIVVIKGEFDPFEN
jgi:hypothetical protein